MGLFNQFPFTNFHEMNLDWIINEIKRIDEYLKNMPIPDDAIKNKNTPDYYGAAGNGVNDDTEAFQKCANYCRENSVPMVLLPKTYYIGGSVNVYTDIVGNYATILSKHRTYPFKVYDENIKQHYTPSNMTRTGTTDTALFGKSFTADTNFNMGARSGANTDFYAQQYIVCDDEGNFTDQFPFYETIKECNNIHSILAEPIKISELIFMANSVDEPCNFVDINRDNVTIENIIVQGTCTSGIQGFNIIGNNIIFRNIIGKNPNTTIGTWGYIITMSSCNNIQLENIILPPVGNRWANIGASFAGNVTYKNVYASRFDIHYLSWGNNSCNNCNFDGANISGGECNYSFVDCTFRTKSYPIASRTDLEAPISGSIYLKNCRYNNTSVLFNPHFAGRPNAGDYSTVFNGLNCNITCENMRVYVGFVYFNDATPNCKLYFNMVNCTLSSINSNYATISGKNISVCLQNCVIPAGLTMVSNGSTENSSIAIYGCRGDGTIRIRNNNNIIIGNQGLTFNVDTSGAQAVYMGNIGTLQNPNNLSADSVNINNIST